MKKFLKNKFRPLKNIGFAGIGYVYDFYRFYKFGGWRKKRASRGYRAVKIYHRLEKSLSFRVQKANSGSDAANALLGMFKEKGFQRNKISYHEKVALKVLSDYKDTIDPNIELAFNISKLSEELESDFVIDGGVTEYSHAELLLGKLESPENFFLTRYSVRDFKSEKVDKCLIERAVRLALKTPSVCNRQAWHVYHIDQREVIDNVLTLQNGNRGFGHEAPCLLLLTVDLNAFDTSEERYQHWIDGGMFSMSILMALHSLGIGSCCLNWSKGVIDDLRLRKKINIAPNHTILMLMAVGYPNENLKVCYSARRPLEEVYSYVNH